MDSGNQVAIDSEVYEQSFSVPFSYPVHFTHSVFNADNPVLSTAFGRASDGRKHRVMVYIDSGVTDTNASVIENILGYFSAHDGQFELAADPVIVTGGEHAKTGWSQVQKIMTELGTLHMCRQSFVLAIGGGSVLDMVGFATALVHRGLRLIRIPTTVLAQNDAGVGVKNGMDEHDSKNYLGVFAPPFAVINDSDFLTTLSDEDWSGGIAEAFKVAIIKDSQFLEFLAENAEHLRARKMAPMEELIRRCAELHLDHIRTSGDPFEFGTARPLDFGHWSAHRLEVMSSYRTSHGCAVSVGIALDSYYAWQTGLITEDEFALIITSMANCGLPIYSELLSNKNKSGTSEILVGLEQFREHLGGTLNVTLPESIGRNCEIHEMDATIIEAGIEYLRKRAG